MKKEFLPIIRKNEHKKRRLQGIIAVAALIATSLHLPHIEPDFLPEDTSTVGIELASYAGSMAQIAESAQQVLDKQVVLAPGLPPTALGLPSIIDRASDVAFDYDPRFGLATPSSCGAMDASCDGSLKTLPRPAATAVLPPEVDAISPPATEVIAATATSEEPLYNPYYDRSVSGEEKWVLAQQLAANSCPSGSLSDTGFVLRAVMGDDHDGLLGYTDPNTHVISIDVRAGHRAIDLAETIVHEQAHARDADGLVDRRRWLDGLGYDSFPSENTYEWFLGDYDPMAPGEAFGRLVSSALLGVDVMNESMANSGYDQDPSAEKLLAQATPDQIALAGELTGCFS